MRLQVPTIASFYWTITLCSRRALPNRKLRISVNNVAFSLIAIEVKLPSQLLLFSGSAIDLDPGCYSCIYSYYNCLGGLGAGVPGDAWQRLVWMDGCMAASSLVMATCMLRVMAGRRKKLNCLPRRMTCRGGRSGRPLVATDATWHICQIRCSLASSSLITTVFESKAAVNFSVGKIDPIRLAFMAP